MIKSSLTLCCLMWAAAGACAAEEAEADLVFAGDVMFDRGVEPAMRLANPLDRIAPLLRGAEVAFCNLESMLGEEGLAPLFPEKPYSFLASTDSARLLAEAGFNVVSLANNHAMDHGWTAIRRTRELLDARRIAHAGAGADLAEARRPATIRTAAGPVCLLAYTVAHAPAALASAGGPGPAPLAPGMILEDVAAAKGTGCFLAVSLHWGTEFSEYPSSAQKETARRIIDGGADMVVGHHPHVPQGLEVYKGRLIAYSLGNLIFDQKSRGAERGVLLKCRLRGGRLSKVTPVPLERDRLFRPGPAEGTAARETLALLRRLSRPLQEAGPEGDLINWGP